MANVTRIAIAGAGRMGHAIAAKLDGHDDLALAGIWSRGDDLDSLVESADIIIDFSLPEATDRVLETALRLGKPLVCGVSGLEDRQMQSIEAASSSIPVVYDRNMSQGIAALHVALESVAGSLGPDCTVTIEEIHHVHKKDAPSGTALALGETLARARGSADIAYKSERVGEVPGDHKVTFRSPTECVELAHSVATRDVFAEGALRAAIWLAQGRAAGLYSMRDVLFL